MCLSELVSFLLFCVSPSVMAQCMDGVEVSTETKGMTLYNIVQPLHEEPNLPFQLQWLINLPKA